MTEIHTGPGNRELLMVAETVAREKSIEKDQVLEAMEQAIQKAGATGDFRATPSRMCNWCAHQALCPAFGGTPPVFPGWPEQLAS